MSTTEEFVPLPLDQIPQINLEGNIVYLDTIPNLQDHLTANGVDSYLVLANEKTSYTENNVTKYTTNTQLFRVTSTIIARTQVAVNAPLKLNEMEPKAYFSLPRIPAQLVKRMDTFFRAIHKKHGTESIVILTYDPTIGGSDGWGIACPDQSNTAANCDYEPQSLAGKIPETAFQVGSAHSHPEMPAYASGTDHKDQANFDGLHITFGWQKTKNSGATEYHIELQIQGRTYFYQPHQIFEMEAEVVEPDEEVLGWMECVQKKAYTSQTTGTQSWKGGTGSTYKSGPHTSVGKKKVELPAGAPSLESSIVIAQLMTEHTSHCPFCQTRLVSSDTDGRRCLACTNYLALPGEGVDDVLKVRKDMGFPASELDASTNPSKAIYMWVKEDGKDSFVPAYQPTLESTAGK